MMWCWLWFPLAYPALFHHRFFRLRISRYQGMLPLPPIARQQKRLTSEVADTLAKKLSLSVQFSFPGLNSLLPTVTKLGTVQYTDMPSTLLQLGSHLIRDPPYSIIRCTESASLAFPERKHILLYLRSCPPL